MIGHIYKTTMESSIGQINRKEQKKQCTQFMSCLNLYIIEVHKYIQYIPKMIFRS